MVVTARMRYFTIVRLRPGYCSLENILILYVMLVICFLTKFSTSMFAKDGEAKKIINHWAEWKEPFDSIRQFVHTMCQVIPNRLVQLDCRELYFAEYLPSTTNRWKWISTAHRTWARLRSQGGRKNTLIGWDRIGFRDTEIHFVFNYIHPPSLSPLYFHHVFFPFLVSDMMSLT